MEWRGSCAIHGWVSSSSSRCPRCADAAEIERLRSLVGGGLPPFPADLADRRRVAERVRDACEEIARIQGGKWGSESQDNGAIVAASKIRALDLDALLEEE